MYPKRSFVPHEVRKSVNDASCQGSSKFEARSSKASPIRPCLSNFELRSSNLVARRHHEVARYIIILLAVALLGNYSLLGQQPRKVSVESLLYDLKNPDKERRIQAAMLLGQNEIRAAVPALSEATRDPEPEVRLEAARALIAIRDMRALNPLVSLLRDPEKDIRLLAMDGIVDLYIVESPGFLDRVRQVADFVNPLSDDFNPKIVDSYVRIDPQAIGALGSCLQDGDAAVRRKAALSLGILRGKQALPEIQNQLQIENNDGVRVELIRAIYKIADSEAARILIPLIRDDDKKVHDEAIYALGRLQVKEAAGPLKELYDDGIEERRKILKVVPVSGKDDLQRNLFRALAYIGDPSCKGLFAEALTDSREFYRRFAAEGLARIADPSLTTTMARSFLREKNESARLAMSYALYRMGRPEHLDDMVLNLSRDQVYGYLLELDSNQVTELYPYLERGEASTIARLLEIIGLKGDQKALEIAERYSQSENAEVLAAATLAIRRLRARGIS